MTALTLALVLASAIVHATWNLWAKQVGATARSGPLMWSLTAFSSVVYAGPALWILAHGQWRPDAGALVLIAGSGIIHVGYFLLLLRGYRRGDLSLVYPVARGTGPMLAALASIVLFSEPPNAASLAGLALIVGGILVLTLKPGATLGGHAGAGLRYGLLTGLSIAVYTLWDGWSVKRAGLPPLVFYWGGEIVRVLLFTPAALADRAGVATLWRTQAWRVVGIAALSPLSYILILLAMRTGAISHIAPAREIGILLGAWLGGSVLGEGERRRRLLASAAFAAGVMALAFA
jgi:multidrug transporter EmrE-like cation transporter